MEIRKRRGVRVLAIIAAFCVAFTSLPMLNGTLDAHAASKSSKAKKVNASTVVNGQNSVTVKWNKLNKKRTGFAVYRDGVLIKHVGRNTTSFTDTGLKAGTTHTYQVKIYKTRKKTQWFNKYTQKWQSKKPKKKKYRGSKRYLYSYSYSYAGTKAKATTKAAPKPPTIPSMSVTTSDLTATSVRLNYASVSNAASYDIYGNNVWWGSTTKTNPKVTGLEAGRTYKFQIKAVNSNDDVIAQSAVISVTTPQSSGGGTGGENPGTGGATPTDPTTPTEPVKINQKTVTDYKGVTREIYQESPSKSHYWICDSDPNANGGATVCAPDQIAKWDRTVDGEFRDGAYKQVSGATFAIKKESYNAGGVLEPVLGEYHGHKTFVCYNLDPAKFDITLGGGVTIEERTWKYWQRNTANVSDVVDDTYGYYVKNGKLLAQAYADNNGKCYKLSTNGNKTTVDVYFNNEDGVGRAIGFYQASIPFTVTYDGKEVGLFTGKNVEAIQDATGNGMSPRRNFALDFAETAINWANNNGVATGTLEKDLNAISVYVYNNYNYNTPVSGFGYSGKLNCIEATYILETWAIDQYGSAGYGFAGWGYGPLDTHVAFHLNSDPGKVWEVSYKNQNYSKK